MRAAKSETLSLLYADTSSTRSWLNACRTPNSNRIDLPKSRSRPTTSFVFVNDRSLLIPVMSVVNSGDCTWCEYDRRKPVCSVIGNETRRRGEMRLWPTAGVNVRDRELAYAVSSDALSGFHSAGPADEMKSGVLGNSALLL